MSNHTDLEQQSSSSLPCFPVPRRLKLCGFVTQQLQVQVLPVCSLPPTFSAQKLLVYSVTLNQISSKYLSNFPLNLCTSFCGLLAKGLCVLQVYCSLCQELFPFVFNLASHLLCLAPCSYVRMDSGWFILFLLVLKSGFDIPFRESAFAERFYTQFYVAVSAFNSQVRVSS